VHSKASALTAQATDLRAEILRRSDTESALETTIARLKFVDKSKNDFINQISHELRTPISNLKLYQDLLSRRPERANSYIPIMEEEIARITSIIEKMIISSELEEENELSTLVMINLGNLISWAIANVQNIAEKHQIHILFTSPHQDYRVWGALIQVQRAIIALLDNAIKYNAGIEIRIELREKHGFYGVSIANPTDFFLAEQSIFEPFVRGENALRLKIAGAGLGLSNARRIIEHYGGTIDINNLQIEGRNWIDFCVWLPMAKENT
jgi:signal transduction histidine kinase